MFLPDPLHIADSPSAMVLTSYCWDIGTLGAAAVHPTVIEVGCVADDAEGVVLIAGQEDVV
jgi:hypothetical protein